MKLVDSVRNASGLYTVREAATYARMHPQTLANWLFGAGARAPLRASLIDKEEGKFLTFVEFVEALAIRNLRTNYGVSFQKIRQAIQEAKEAYQVEYPFADRDHKTYLIGSDLHILLKGEEHPVQLTGKQKKQASIRPCLERFMRDLEWDNETQRAAAYVAYRYPNPGPNITIRMRPNHYFGAPVVDRTGYTAETLWRAAVAEGSFAKVAEYYEVGETSVMAACRYCEELQLAA